MEYGPCEEETVSNLRRLKALPLRKLKKGQAPIAEIGAQRKYV
jgi:hypothetical protein